MFEDSMFESMGTIRTRSRRWMLATFALNSAILLALVLIPLLDPQALPRLAESILMEAPPPRIEPPPAQPQPAHATVLKPQVPYASVQAPSVIPKQIPLNDGPEESPRVSVANLSSDGIGTASPDNPWNGQPSVTVVQQKPQPPTPISSGVMTGRIVYQVTPSYPPIAKAAGAGGTVILQATISKSGSIENLRVLSGPALLQQAALDAVKQWRYRPYLLNGQPIEVETTVNVVFKLN